MIVSWNFYISEVFLHVSLSWFEHSRLGEILFFCYQLVSFSEKQSALLGTVFVCFTLSAVFLKKISYLSNFDVFCRILVQLD